VRVSEKRKTRTESLTYPLVLYDCFSALKKRKPPL